jgi:hypothetical protein
LWSAKEVKEMANRSPLPTTTPVRYVKLGEKGRWENECLEKGIMRFGFGSCSQQRLPLCRAGKWDDLQKSYIEESRAKGTAKRSANETRTFFEDDGSILWITFAKDPLNWGFRDSALPEAHADSEGGVWRKVADGWCDKDLTGHPLTTDRLSGALTKLAAYRGTSCNVDVAEYAIRRINGQQSPEAERALAALQELRTVVVDLIKLLRWRDFETLVDLIFSTSGWRRQGPVGGTQKTKDIELVLPSTNESGFVQVKSDTTQSEFAHYLKALHDLDQYDRLFFVYHSCSGVPIASDDDRVTIIGPERVATMVVDAGLVNWVIDKVA